MFSHNDYVREKKSQISGSKQKPILIMMLYKLSILLIVLLDFEYCVIRILFLIGRVLPIDTKVTVVSAPMVLGSLFPRE